MRLVVGLLCVTCTTMVHAEIYKYVDESGHVTYSNAPRPGAQTLEGGSTRPNKTKPKTASPYYFPRVDKATQNQRDAMRKQLLLDELQNEQRSLETARAAQRQAGTHPGQAAETVRLHEKNIEMLNKELSRIK